MKSKRWGIAAIATAIVATFCVVGTSPAQADPAGPTVTSVDRSGAQPVITIDWGSYADAPVGVLESVDGYKLGTPADMTTVTDDYGTSPGLRSYRAAACYENCDLDSIKAGQATLVQGDWLRPDVGDVTSKSAPVVSVNWQYNHFNFWPDFDTLEPGVAIAVYRNGVPIGFLGSGALFLSDDGPFTDPITYAVAGCYADCTVEALTSGFAMQTAPGEDHTFHAASGPVPTATTFACHGFFVVGYPVSCSALVYSSVFTLTVPSGTVNFGGDDDVALPHAQCVLDNGYCQVRFASGHGSAGSHVLTASYLGDQDDMTSSYSQAFSWDRRRSWTSVACQPATSVYEATCEATVFDGDAGDPLPVTGSVTVDPGLAGVDPAACTLDDGGRCTVEFNFPPGTHTLDNIVGAYSGDDDHRPSTSGPTTLTLSRLESQTDVECASSTVTAGQTLSCTVTVTDEFGSPVPEGSAQVRSSGRGGSTSQECVLHGGICSVLLVPRSEDAGQLTIAASYSGTTTYLPSDGTTSVTVMEPTALVAQPAIANLVSPTKVTLTMSATLTDALDHSPIAGETVRFVANGTTLCTGVTDASGVASCSGLTEVAQAANGYKAFFDGNATTYRLKSSTSGAGVRL